MPDASGVRGKGPFQKHGPAVTGYSGAHAKPAPSLILATLNSVGSLSVSARYAGGRLSGLAVALERPPVARLFLGQAPGAVVRMVPLLYSLCARAQAAAAAAALAAASAAAPPPEESAALWAEALHEHFWRLLLDWPPALGQPQAREAFIAWRAARSGAAFPSATRALLESTLLGCPAADWQRGEARLGSDSLAARCMSRLKDTENAAFFDPPALTPDLWLPYWRTGCSDIPETPCPASIGAAWRSRLRQAVAAVLALEAGTPYPVAAAGEGGWGIGQVLTARGLLTHGARLENGRVSAYQVWAPTDCHFADGAGLARLLENGVWQDIDAARRAVEQAVLALDPCVPYTVKVSDA